VQSPKTIEACRQTGLAAQLAVHRLYHGRLPSNHRWLNWRLLAQVPEELRAFGHLLIVELADSSANGPDDRMRRDPCFEPACGLKFELFQRRFRH
jgi:hypothetical protein